MVAAHRIEQALLAAVHRGDLPGCPPRLAEALHHAVFPGGARIRPRLCLAVAGACGDDAPEAAEGAAAAIELLHCASLVHDDLPCFDDAATRRGKPALHRAFGEPLAVLAGDALIVLAFQTLAGHTAAHPDRLGRLVAIVGDAVGVPRGIVAGQAWESEPDAALGEYQREKTGALFVAACMAGAAAAGKDPEPWRALGDRLGEAYQVADDLKDVAAEADELGKPTGQDARCGRPSAAAELGVEGALARLEQLVASAAASIPDSPGADELKALVRSEAKRLRPKSLAPSAV